MARANNMPENPIDQIARSLDLLLRLRIDEIKGDRTQRDMIRYLGTHGATAGEIASYLGVNTSTVHPELSKARASKVATKKKTGRKV